MQQDSGTGRWRVAADVDVTRIYQPLGASPRLPLTEIDTVISTRHDWYRNVTTPKYICLRRLATPILGFPMSNELPLAYYITWTVYGTHLQGAATGWRKFGRGFKSPQPLLEAWHEERLNYPIQLLNEASREIVATKIEEHCQHRSWHLWIANPRSNHVHVVVTATDYHGAIVRDQLKANCTIGLRIHDAIFKDRPVWTKGGDWQCVNTEEDLHSVIEYVRDAQDRKDEEGQ